MENRKAGYKRPNQKCKTLLIAHILMRRTDEDHMMSLSEIQSYLEAYGVEADVHTIGRNIKELSEFLDPEKEVELPDTERPLYKIVYDAKGKRGFKVAERPYKFQDIQLLAECINSSKFISDAQSKKFKKIIGENLCSTWQEEILNSEVYVYQRPRKSNSSVMESITTINKAIKQNKKIKFQYLKYTLSNLSEQVPRRKGEYYIYSPFGLLSNNGNYYLLAFDSKSRKMITFRVDRMKKVFIKDEPREGAEVYNSLDLRTYTQRVFSMYSGEGVRVEMKFTNDLLDTVIEQFDPKDAFYSKVDDTHFSVSTNVEVSDQFFSWICSFRKKATIVGPAAVVEKMKAFLEDICGKY